MTSKLNPTTPPIAANFLQDVAVLILTYNEAPNIARTLDALIQFPEVVVLDSGSTDDTVAIARHYPNVRIAARPFDQHSIQWNHGLTACNIERQWIMALDADYVLPPDFVEEVAHLPLKTSIAGYQARFRYCIQGRRLTGTIYPPHVVLYRRDKAHYIQVGHTQRVIVEGQVAELASRICHDDRKPLIRWLQSQQNYARLEAEYLLSSPPHKLRLIDRLRLRGWPAPLIIAAYTLIVKRCLFDGVPGWQYMLQRTLAEIMIALEIGDRRLRNRLMTGAER